LKLDGKGRVTIPVRLREKYHLSEGDEIDVIEEDEGTLGLVRITGARTYGQRLIHRLRGSATAPEVSTMTTDELMELSRGE